MRKIIILGSGYSIIDYKYKEGDTVWCPLSMFIEGAGVAQYFGMHDSDVGAREGLIDQSNYPLEEISNKYETCYFTNTISYILAYALYVGIEEIDVYGVDMALQDEYYTQRPSVMYWVGYLRASGVKVNMKNDFDKPYKIYGYETGESLKTKIEQMRKDAILNKDNSTSVNQKNQYIGMIHTLNIIEREL